VETEELGSVSQTKSLLQHSKTPLPLGHPSGVLRVDVLQCTTLGHLRVCRWRAAQNRRSVLTITYGAVTKEIGKLIALLSTLVESPHA
jgi:hypothetical protein